MAKKSSTGGQPKANGVAGGNPFVSALEQLAGPAPAAPKAPASTLERLLLAKQSPVDIKEVSYEFHKKVGGASGLADMVLKEYAASQAGSLARIRIIDVMVRLFQANTPKAQAGETGLLSDEDLIDAYVDQAKKAGAGIKRIEAAAPKKKDVWIDHVCI